jgi:hypothetical protein
LAVEHGLWHRSDGSLADDQDWLYRLPEKNTIQPQNGTKKAFMPYKMRSPNGKQSVRKLPMETSPGIGINPFILEKRTSADRILGEQFFFSWKNGLIKYRLEKCSI